jgi:hypothetical protein
MGVVAHFNSDIDDPESEELCQYVRDGIERLAVDSIMRSKTGSQFPVARIERVKRVDAELASSMNSTKDRSNGG